jgi:hypothetical protein
MSTLDHYFCCPSGSFIHHNDQRWFRDLTYVEYYSLFRLKKYDNNHVLQPNYFVEQLNQYGQPPMHVILHNEGWPHLARIHDIPPSHGEVFYLRTLLQYRPSISHEAERTVDGVEYDTYQEAAMQLGLFANEKEAEYALLEGIQNLKTLVNYGFFLYTCSSMTVYQPPCSYGIILQRIWLATTSCDIKMYSE